MINYKALMKIRGMLCIGVLKPAEDAKGKGRCPLCKGTEFKRIRGWVECANCIDDYAINLSCLTRIQNEISLDRQLHWWLYT